jgi:hypothetical protein
VWKLAPDVSPAASAVLKMIDKFRLGTVKMFLLLLDT